jgi:hypothetical protein
MEKIFPADILTKRERVERTLCHQPVDRVALWDGLQHSPRVIGACLGREIQGFDYTVEDVGEASRRTLDLCMPISAPQGTDRVTLDDGLVVQNENWMRWVVQRPFADVRCARDWLLGRTELLRKTPFDRDAEWESYHRRMAEMQRLVGETVIMDFSWTGFSYVFRAMGIDLFVYFYEDYPQVFADFLECTAEREIRRIHAVADVELSPVILVPEDFATKQGPMFSPAFLGVTLFPYVARMTEAWHSHGIRVLFHSDGNWKKVIHELVGCGVDGFYCLEPSLGMDIVELMNARPDMVWAGGVDGVDLMERGTPEQVRAEVHRHILGTNALQTGGMFVGTSSEVNPPIPAENFMAMVYAVGELRNEEFAMESEPTCSRN